MDGSRLAECLGVCLMFYKKTWKLDPTRFRTSSGADQRTFSALGAQISDAERFRDATRFRWHLPGPTCLFYKRTGSYHDMLIVLSLKISILLITGTAGPVCSKPISPGKPDWRFIEVLRGFDDSTCNYSTRMMGVYARLWPALLTPGMHRKSRLQGGAVHFYAFWNYYQNTPGPILNYTIGD